MLFFHRQLYLYLIICKFTHYIHTKKLSLGNFQYSDNHIVLIMSKYDKAGAAMQHRLHHQLSMYFYYSAEFLLNHSRRRLSGR